MPSRRIEVEIIGSPASLKAALGASDASLSAFEKRTKALSRSMISTGRTMTRNITLPIVGAGVAAGKLAFDYDNAITHVQALTGASAKQTKEWSDQLLKLGPRIGQTPQELADALYFVASSGAKVNQVLPITKAAAKDAAAGMGDAQTVAQLLTSAINAYGPKALSAAKASDVLTASIKVGKAEPAEFAAELGKVIPVAQNLGISFAEVSAATASLTNTGLDAATATTGLRNIMLKIMAPTAGSVKEFKRLGLTVDELQKSVRTKGLLATLRDLSDRVDGNRQAMHKMFPDARGLTALLALVGPNADRAAGALAKVEHSTGAADKAFRTASKGPGMQFRKELAQLEATGIRIGNDLLPVFLDVAGTVADLADSFDHLSDGEKHAIEIGLGIAALSGPLLTVGGNVVRLVGLFGKLGKAAGTAAAAEEAAGGAAAAGGLALGPLAIAAGAAAAGYLLWTHRAKTNITVSDEWKKKVAELNSTIQTGQMNVTGWRQTIGEATTQARQAQTGYAKLASAGLGKVSDEAKKSAQGSLRQYVGQMLAVSAQARAASHDTEHFGAATRAQYAHVAALAATTARLAQAMNSVPNQKYVSLVLSVTTNLKTEGLAPGQGRETGAGLGTYTPPSGGGGGGSSGPHKAMGGRLIAGRDYIVGERGIERFTPDASGYLTPNHKLGSHTGDAVELVITNWHEGRGYMRQASRGVVAAGALRNRQLERMGSDA